MGSVFPIISSTQDSHCRQWVWLSQLGSRAHLLASSGAFWLTIQPRLHALEQVRVSPEENWSTVTSSGKDGGKSGGSNSWRYHRDKWLGWQLVCCIFSICPSRSPLHLPLHCPVPLMCDLYGSRQWGPPASGFWLDWTSGRFQQETGGKEKVRARYLLLWLPPFLSLEVGDQIRKWGGLSVWLSPSGFR